MVQNTMTEGIMVKHEAHNKIIIVLQLSSLINCESSRFAIVKMATGLARYKAN